MSLSSSPLVDPTWVVLSEELEAEIEAGTDLFDCEVVRLSMLFEHPPAIEAMRPAVAPLGLDLRSPTDVHHAFHLLQVAHLDPEPLVVAEWGGGYGGMARLGRQLWPDCEWHILDLPGPSRAQALFLADVEGVYLWDVSLIDLFPDADLFVSTFALSESPPAARQLVIERDWFGAANILLAFEDDKPGFGPGFKDWVGNFDLTEHPHLPGNFYGLLAVR